MRKRRYISRFALHGFPRKDKQKYTVSSCTNSVGNFIIFTSHLFTSLVSLFLLLLPLPYFLFFFLTFTSFISGFPSSCFSFPPISRLFFILCSYPFYYLPHSLLNSPHNFLPILLLPHFHSRLLSLLPLLSSFSLPFFSPLSLFPPYSLLHSLIPPSFFPPRFTPLFSPKCNIAITSKTKR